MTSKFDKTTVVIAVVVLIFLVVICFYFFNFNHYIIKNEGWLNVFQNLSEETGNWGTFGDYVGGILNPVIAGFALYLIVETYKLQKDELEKTRDLLKVSTDAQKDQLTLVALTALLSSNLTRINLLRSEKSELLNEITVKPKAIDTRSNEDMTPFDRGCEKVVHSHNDDNPTMQRIREINGEIKILSDKNTSIEKQIESFLSCNELSNTF